MDLVQQMAPSARGYVGFALEAWYDFLPVFGSVSSSELGGRLC